MTRREYTILDIHMALDGEMPAEERDDFEVWLDANPQMKALSGLYAADLALVQGVFAPVLQEPLPNRLSKVLSDEEAEGESRRPISRLPWRSGAAAALVLMSAAAGYCAGISQHRPLETGTDAVVERALEAHAMYAAEKLHVVEVGADQKDHLVAWLSNKVGVPLVAPDLSAEGFRLVGGRLLPAGGNSAAQLMYQDRAGTRVSLYVTADAGSSETGFRLYEEEDGARAFYWIDRGFCYAIVGRAPEETLLEVANAAYRQLLDATAVARPEQQGSVDGR